MSGPSEERRTPEDPKGISGYARAYQKAAPYTGASFSLVASVGVFSWLGHLLDAKLENEKPWFLLLGALLGMVGGFVSFFNTVMKASRKNR